MTILVDADACPVVSIVVEEAMKREIPVVLLCDTAHILRSEYAQVVVVDQGADSADFELVSRTHTGDLVVTQDYGVAAMVLGKGALAVHQSGRVYTNDNIDGLLMERHMAKEARRSRGRGHSKGPRKRQPEDDDRFRESLIKLLM